MSGKATAGPGETRARPVRLDAADLRILDVLQREGRITKLDLARRVNLSPTPCWERMHRLERAGIIAGYGARLRLAHVAPSTTVLVEVTLRRHRQADFTRFEDAVRAEPEVVACDATGGGIDYVLRVVTRDVARYQTLIERLLDGPPGIESYTTYVVTKPVKEAAPLPLARLLAASAA